jgi:hypothetical protein
VRFVGAAKAVLRRVRAVAGNQLDGVTRFSFGVEMVPRERLTLEVGSSIVLGALAFGLQVGHWPIWSAALALAGYLAWTILYSEATIQAPLLRFRVESLLATRRLQAAQAAAPPG